MLYQVYETLYQYIVYPDWVLTSVCTLKCIQLLKCQKIITMLHVGSLATTTLAKKGRTSFLEYHMLYWFSGISNPYGLFNAKI